MADVKVIPRPPPASTSGGGNRRPSAIVAKRTIRASAAAAASASTVLTSDALWNDDGAPSTPASQRKKKVVDPSSDEFKERYADTAAALTYCYQRSPDAVAANALVAASATAASTEESMADAYDAVYQSFQPLMLLARRVVEYDKANKKEQVPEHMTADVEAALKVVAERIENAANPEFWLGDTSKRAADAQLVIVDAELANLLIDAAPATSPRSLSMDIVDNVDDDDMPLRPTSGFDDQK